MPQVEGAPKGLNEILESTYQDCKKDKKLSEEKCSKVAWAAAKKKYKKVGRKWIRKNV